MAPNLTPSDPGSLTDAELRAEAVPVVNPSGPAAPHAPPASQLPTPDTSTSQEVIQQQTSVQDYVILRYAVVGLILIALISIIGSLFLIKVNNEIQAGVTAVLALGGVAVGSIGTMLTRPPLYPQQPPAVRMGATDRRQG